MVTHFERSNKDTVRITQAKGLVYGLVGFHASATARSYQGGEMMMMKSVYWWRKPE